jgi:DNA mismatch repair protein MutS
MMKQYLAIKREHPDAILFFRMGDFYEMFMDDAVLAADILKIALTTRDKGKKNSVPMCGIPYHAAQTYLTRLVQSGHKVAICDQVEDPSKAKGLVKREVTRIVTPGTVVEDTLLDAEEPSYLAAVHGSGNDYGLSLVEVSTGEFLVAGFEGKQGRSGLLSTLAQYSPREILIPEEWEAEDLPGHTTSVEPYRFNQDAAEDSLKEFFNVKTIAGFGDQLDGLALGAAGAALWYLGNVHQGVLGHLRPARVISNEDILVLDENALKNLEILRSSHDGKRGGSLLGVMDQTVTGPGARLLREMLTRPLQKAPEIEKRLDLVQELIEEPLLRGKIRKNLRQVCDIERVLSRFSAGTAGPRDAVALSQTLEQIPHIMELLSELDSDLGESMCRRIQDTGDLTNFLSSALSGDAPATLKDGGVFSAGHSDELDGLRSMASDGRKFLSELEAREKQRTSIPSLKIGFNRIFGYYLEVTNVHRELVPEEWIRKQTLVNGERYITEELKDLEEKILSAQERMIALERELFEDLRSRVLGATVKLQETAHGLAMADVFGSLAELAHSSSYVRPMLLDDDSEGRIFITQGRHPVLEKLGPGETFVPNDVYLDSGSCRMIILTGPNMAGKSTFMRQVALIVIMAQMGSFVPAREALISPADRIFTRVGAADLLTKGLSTFMVEMVETADILNNATGKSLVILDEIGRGTSTFDGISIAWAVAEDLLEGRCAGCRTLFATHFHELTELALTSDGVRNFNVAIREWGEKLVFLHRVQEGPADKSYGISVGRLAGLPDVVVERAREILANLESHALDSEGIPVLIAPDQVQEDKHTAAQLVLFQQNTRDVLEMVLSADIDNLSPIEALNLLARMKKYKIHSTDE